MGDQALGAGRELGEERVGSNVSVSDRAKAATHSRRSETSVASLMRSMPVMCYPFSAPARDVPARGGVLRCCWPNAP